MTATRTLRKRYQHGASLYFGLGEASLELAGKSTATLPCGAANRSVRVTSSYSREVVFVASVGVASCPNQIRGARARQKENLNACANLERLFMRSPRRTSRNSGSPKSSASPIAAPATSSPASIASPRALFSSACKRSPEASRSRRAETLVSVAEQNGWPRGASGRKPAHQYPRGVWYGRHHGPQRSLVGATLRSDVGEADHRSRLVSSFRVSGDTKQNSRDARALA